MSCRVVLVQSFSSNRSERISDKSNLLHEHRNHRDVNHHNHYVANGHFHLGFDASNPLMVQTLFIQASLNTEVSAGSSNSRLSERAPSVKPVQPFRQIAVQLNNQPRSAHNRQSLQTSNQQGMIQGLSKSERSIPAWELIISSIASKVPPIARSSTPHLPHVLTTRIKSLLSQTITQPCSLKTLLPIKRQFVHIFSITTHTSSSHPIHLILQSNRQNAQINRPCRLRIGHHRLRSAIYPNMFVSMTCTTHETNIPGAQACITLPQQCNGSPDCMTLPRRDQWLTNTGICKDQQWISDISCCISKACSTSDQQAALAFAQNICTPVGATLVSSSSFRQELFNHGLWCSGRGYS